MADPAIVMLLDHRDIRKAKPERKPYRQLSMPEIKQLVRGQWIFVKNIQGTEAYHCRITSIKTWKTQPDRIEIGVVFGLRDFFSFSMHQALDRIVLGMDTDADCLTVGEEGTLSHFDRYVAGDR